MKFLVFPVFVLLAFVAIAQATEVADRGLVSNAFTCGMEYLSQITEEIKNLRGVFVKGKELAVEAVASAMSCLVVDDDKVKCVTENFLTFWSENAAIREEITNEGKKILQLAKMVQHCLAE